MNRTMATKAMSQTNEEANDVIRRGPWTLEEDNLLIRYITCHGEGRWNLLAKCAGLKRTGKSCRLRWLNYLKPDIKHGNLTPHEQLLILELHSRWGNRWSKIAQQLQGRTDNEIKNYWRTRVQKQARQLKIDSNSKRFLEVIRCYYMPRLLEKMDQTSSSSASPTSSNLTMESQSSVVVPSELTNREPFVLSSQSRKVVEDFNHVTESSSSLISSELSPPLDSERKLELVPQFSGHPISPAANFCDNVYYYNALVDDPYHVESNKFGMEGSNQEEISGLCAPSISLLDCQMVDNDWLCDMNASTWMSFGSPGSKSSWNLCWG